MSMPAFDPSASFEAVSDAPPPFDPSKPFEPAHQGPLSNAPDDGWATGFAKGVPTAVIKGLSHYPGQVADTGNFADYLLARGHSAITGKPVEDVLAGYAAQRKAHAEGSTLGRVAEGIDPSQVLPTSETVAKPVLDKTGEYVPTSEPGKMGMAGVEMATAMLGPGGGALARGVAAGKAITSSIKMAPAAFAAGAVGQGVTDMTGDPLIGMAAGMVAPAAGGAAASAARQKIAPVVRPFVEDVPGFRGRYAGEREQMVREKLQDSAQDPAAFEHSLFPGPRKPGSDEIIPGSQPTLGQHTGDMGILEAERKAATSDNPDFLNRAAEQNSARRAALEKTAPDADVMRPSKFFQDQLETIERGANDAVGRIEAGAQHLAGKLGPGETPEAIGSAIRTPIKSVYDQARKARNALYAAVDPDGKVTVVATPLRDRGQELIKGMDPYDTPLSSEESRIFGRIKSLPDVVSFKSLNALDKDIYAVMSAERRSAGETPTWGRLSQLKKGVMSAINDAVENQHAYEQAAVKSGKLKPSDTIEARLEQVHGEYHGQLGRPAGRAEAVAEGDTGSSSPGLLDVRGAEGAGAGRSGNAPGTEGIPGRIPANPQDLNNFPIYYPGGNLRARYEVADLPSLITSHDANFSQNPKFPQELQPRARESAPARDQVNNMAARLQPERLGPSPEANSGAPIVGPDNVVESGNGRTLALAKHYQKGGKEYRDWLASQGFDTAGMKQPVLIARRTSEMSPAQREYFANSANSSSTLKMSAAEQAASDAKMIKPDSLGLLAEGPIRSAENRDFVRSFAEKLPAAERGGILDKDGNLSQSGIRRIEGALAAKAFDDTAFVARAFDSADSNIKNLAGALVDAAGPWARMREAAHSGAIDGSHDITHELMDVVHKVMRARDEGVPVADILKQTDMFGSDVAPLVQSLLFRNVENGALASRQRIASGLKTYAAEAEKNVAGPRLLDDEVKPRDVFKTAISKAAPEVEEAVGKSEAPTFETGSGETTRGLEPNFDPAARDRLRAAKDSHIALADTYRNPTIKPVLKTLGSDTFSMADSAVPSKAVLKGPRGYEVAKQFLKAAGNEPGAVNAMMDQALAPLRKSLLPNGTVNPKSFASWKSDYAQALRAIDEVQPGFSKKFDNAAKASDLMVEAGALAKSKIDVAQKSEAAKFIKASTPAEVEERIGTIINSKTGPSQMRDLVRSADGNPEVIAGLQKASIDWITRKISSTMESGTTGEKKLAVNALVKLLRDKATTLEALHPPETVATLRAIVHDMEITSRRLATNIPGSPGSAKDVAPQIQKAMDATKRHTSMIAAAMSGIYAGFHFGGLKGALVAGGLEAGGYALGTMRAAGINKVDAMFRDALLNPERARYYLAKIPPGAKPETGPLFALSRAIRRELAGAQTDKDSSDHTVASGYPAKKKVNRAYGGRVYFAEGGAAFGTQSPAEEAEAGPNFLDRIFASAVHGIATLPKRAIENSQYSLDSGTYDPAVPVEAALMTMGATPFGASAKAGETALGAGPTIKAYHGSPHDFDRFDLSKIGTGEGAQAYGHGLYFAENEGVAKGYRERLATKAAIANVDNTPQSMAALAVQATGEAQARQNLLNNMQHFGESHPVYVQSKAAIKAIDDGSYKAVPIDKGHMYEVQINADPAHFLDWDKPLSQQGELVQRSVPPLNVSARSIGVNPNLGEELFDVTTKGGGSLGTFPKSKLDEVMSNPSKFDPRTGGMIYESRGLVPGDYADKTAATKALLDRGIPGIKYLDQGSRGAGEGSSNYVVFNDKIIDILKKYGVGSVAALPPAVQYSLSKEKAELGL